MINNITFTEWSTQAHPIVVLPCTGNAGPKVPLPHDPLGLFSFFDNSVVGSKRTATQQGAMKQWSTNAEEIRAYFGFMILMGINRLPEIRDYWCMDKALRYAPITDRSSFRGPQHTPCAWRSKLFTSPESRPHHRPSQRSPITTPTASSV